MKPLRRALFVHYASIVGALVLLTVSAPGQTLSLLHTFRLSDGGLPSTKLLRDAAGNLYGTTPYGADFSCDPDLGGGTVFKIDTSGKLTNLHVFIVTDGCFPSSGLTMDAAGNLYGTTLNNILFKIDAAGTYSVLYTFSLPTGWQPEGGLLLDGHGNLFGITSAGGNLSCGLGLGCGTVFKLDSLGNLTFLYNFAGGTDGATPQANLIQDSVGNLYGTSAAGGNANCLNGCGTVFKLDLHGNETVLYRFAGGNDGFYPPAGLIRDAAGNLYGVTNGGGDLNCGNGNGVGCGTAFRLDPTGKKTTLYAFTGVHDGAFPSSQLIRDNAGNLYGVTGAGGDHFDDGTIFMLDKTGKETVLNRFDGLDGSRPRGGIIRDAFGNFYGTTTYGGSPIDEGTVFKFTP